MVEVAGPRNLVGKAIRGWDALFGMLARFDGMAPGVLVSPDLGALNPNEFTDFTFEIPDLDGDSTNEPITNTLTLELKSPVNHAPVVDAGKNLKILAKQQGDAELVGTATDEDGSYMVIGLAPVIGVPLPLFSYGGSALVTTCVLIGLLMNVSMRRYVF